MRPLLFLRQLPVRAPGAWSWAARAAAVLAIGVSAAVPVGDAAAAQTPVLSLTPTSGAVGAGISVQGRGFPRRQSGQLFWDGATAGLPAVQTDKNGSFTVTTRVPSTTVGSHRLYVTIVGMSAETPF